MFARLTGDVRTAAATGGHALLSAASFRRGLPTFPRHSQGSREHSAFPPFFFARILLFLNLFPVGLFTAAVYKHRANQNERAIADTLDLPVQPQRNKTLRPSCLSTRLCPPSVFSLQLCSGTLERAIDQIHFKQLGSYFSPPAFKDQN